MKKQFFYKSVKTVGMALLASSMMVACGSKNSVSSNGDSSIGTSPLTAGNPGLASKVQQMKSQFPCSGNYRAVEVNFKATGTTYSTLDQFASGSASGTATKLYAAKNSMNDLVFVTKMANGSQVTGYNIHVRLCTTFQQSELKQLVDDYQRNSYLSLLDNNYEEVGQIAGQLFMYYQTSYGASHLTQSAF